MMSHDLAASLIFSVIQYERGRSTADFVKFLNENCGTKRLPGGELSPEVRMYTWSHVVQCVCLVQMLYSILPTHIQYTHQMHAQAGLVEDMNELASRFITETEARETILTEAKSVAESHEDPK